MNPVSNAPIILASTSPRRRDLLRSVSLPFEVMAPDADESHRRGEGPRAYVRRVTRAKAESVVPAVLRRSPAALIVAADTVVIEPDGKKVIGKPRDEVQAKRMLKRLAGRTHTVLTAYCVLPAKGRPPGDMLLKVVASKVRIRKLAAADIERYVSTGESMDKAGAYAAQGHGMALIESITGSYANVVGLPVCQLLQDLEERFGIGVFERPDRRRRCG